MNSVILLLPKFLKPVLKNSIYSSIPGSQFLNLIIIEMIFGDIMGSEIDMLKYQA